MKNTLVPKTLVWRKSTMPSIVQKKNIPVWIGYPEGLKIPRKNWQQVYCSFHYNNKGQGILIIMDIYIKQVRLRYRNLEKAQEAAARWFNKSRLLALKYYYK